MIILYNDKISFVVVTQTFERIVSRVFSYVVHFFVTICYVTTRDVDSKLAPWGSLNEVKKWKLRASQLQLFAGRAI